MSFKKPFVFLRAENVVNWTYRTGVRLYLPALVSHRMFTGSELSPSLRRSRGSAPVYRRISIPEPSLALVFPAGAAKRPAGCCEIQIRRLGSKEGLRALDMDCLELVGIEAEQLQDSWGDLRRLYRRRDARAADRPAPCH